ncbi:MAG: hypothetical protein E6K73_10980 [Candidatus Eisenbacteria bacterium]|uniref:Uncharacterized protein n=1 Tax=Eiseniibacteriota bacterium TaxID=2212470 RepID=A0A538SBW1_UNCEI|nr:MAG: hypothetical protein E6K73_10980 [Candidatus Eisenbacteria bacterium]
MKGANAETERGAGPLRTTIQTQNRTLGRPVRRLISWTRTANVWRSPAVQKRPRNTSRMERRVRTSTMSS